MKRLWFELKGKTRLTVLTCHSLASEEMAGEEARVRLASSGDTGSETAAPVADGAASAADADEGEDVARDAEPKAL